MAARGEIATVALVVSVAHRTLGPELTIRFGEPREGRYEALGERDLNHG